MRGRGAGRRAVPVRAVPVVSAAGTAVVTTMRPCRVAGRWGLAVRLAVDLDDHPDLREVVISGPPDLVLAHAAQIRAGGHPFDLVDPVEVVWWRAQWRVARMWLISAVWQVVIVAALLALGAELTWWNGAVAGAVVGVAVGALHEVATCTPRRPWRWSR